jgi:hypothetical protein
LRSDLLLCSQVNNHCGHPSLDLLNKVSKAGKRSVKERCKHLNKPIQSRSPGV